MIEQVAAWLQESRHTVAFTGAGISTESGIPDFRSPGGIWSDTDPVMFQDFVASAEARDEYWRQKSAAYREYSEAKPNGGHEILAAWESRGLLQGVITQNIDGLHQQAGSTAVQEIHGTARVVSCLDCGFRDDAGKWVGKYFETGAAPRCPSCAGPLKHATISFGQDLDKLVLGNCSRWSRECELLLVMGSSLAVRPAADLPVLAKQTGSRVVIINRDPTALDDMADLVIHGGLGDTLATVNAILPQVEHTAQDPRDG